MIIIVGAGLFGSIAAALARKAGYKVIVVDGNVPLAASRCSGNLFKPSWLESIGKERAEAAYEVLQQLYPLQKIDCLIRPLLNRHVELNWVDPKLVLRPPDLRAGVTQARNGVVVLQDGTKLRGKVLVAAGVYSAELVTMPPIRWLVGSSARIPGQVKQASLYMYAPYKHAIAYNITPKEIWFGDGAAILQKNWTDDRLRLLKTRALKYFGLRVTEIRVGARPYVEGYKQGYFAQVDPSTWVSTGGAKNGLVLAAYQAQQFMEAL